MAGEDIEKALERIVSPIRNDLKGLTDRLTELENGKGVQQAFGNTGGSASIQAQPMRLGAFNHSKLTDTKEEIYCPTCGTVERRTIPVHEVEREVVKEKPVVPENYMPVPQKFNDFQKMLDDMEHPDGHHLMDCPSCAPKMVEWIEKHGFVKAPEKKSKK